MTEKQQTEKQQTELRNSDRFISAYNRIDQEMKNIIHSTDHHSFFRLIDMAKKKSAVIRRHEADLREFGDLRNAIVHHRTSVEYVIAEPHDDVVAKMEEIEQALMHPHSVGETFKRDVLTFQIGDSLSYALKIIRERKFNQFPVFLGSEFRGLVTPVGITAFLASNIKEDTISLRKTTLADILVHENRRNNHRFISRDTSAYVAEEMFKAELSRGHRLEALLITEDGKPSSELVGIITPFDILKLN